jgi:hypothetical protein
MSKYKRNKKIECGAGTDISCADLFRKRYYEKYDSSSKKLSFGKIRLLILKLAKNKEFKFREAFDDWPKTKYGDFDEIFFNNQVEGFYELILQELIKREKKDKEFKIDNIDGWVRRVINNFIHNETAMHRHVKKRLVSNQMVADLRVLLGKPDLNMEMLTLIAQKSLSIEVEKLKEDIKEIPGYRNVWFKIQIYNQEQRLFVCETYQDRIDKVEFLTATRRDVGQNK